MQQVEQRVVHSITHQNRLDRLSSRIQRAVSHFFHASPTRQRAKDLLNGVSLAHPLHPALTDVPVGAWTTALLLDGVESATGRDLKGATAAAISIGIGGAVVSALSGVADWADTSDEQRQIGLVHAATNSAALALYTASLWRRLSGRPTGAKALSAAGYALLSVGAYLGGDLVYRLGTQVSRNAWTRTVARYTPVMDEASLPPERPTRADADGVPLMLVRHHERIYVLSDTCSHAGCNLSQGRLRGDTIQCRCHGSTYRLEDGAPIHGPSPHPQPWYDVRINAGRIEVRSQTR